MSEIATLQAERRNPSFMSLDGRATRLQYWRTIFLIETITWLSFAFCVLLCLRGELDLGLLFAIFILCVVGNWIATFPITIRRLHDCDMSAMSLWVIRGIETCTGMVFIEFFICGFLPGSVGMNRFGADPRGRLNGLEHGFACMGRNPESAAIYGGFNKSNAVNRKVMGAPRKGLPSNVKSKANPTVGTKGKSLGVPGKRTSATTCSVPKGAKSSQPETTVQDRLRNLNSLKDQGLLTPEEYAEKRREILGAI